MLILHFNEYDEYRYTLFDTEEYKIVYSEPLKGRPYGYDCKIDGKTGEYYMYSYDPDQTGAVDGAYKTYFYPDGGVTKEVNRDEHRHAGNRLSFERRGFSERRIRVYNPDKITLRGGSVFFSRSET
ncbi:MAG: hypothetical protein LBI38_06800 [Oscillospiraceae bacterium]|nr:hypothetical protein [Oscillospiraceae bacterium]